MDIVEKCARAASDEIADQVRGDGSRGVETLDVTGIALAVIDALAEGVTIEMGVALERALSEGDGGRDLGGNYKLRALSSAIRAAKEGT